MQTCAMCTVVIYQNNGSGVVIYHRILILMQNSGHHFSPPRDLSFPPPQWPTRHTAPPAASASSVSCLTSRARRRFSGGSGETAPFDTRCTASAPTRSCRSRAAWWRAPASPARSPSSGASPSTRSEPPRGEQRRLQSRV